MKLISLNISIALLLISLTGCMIPSLPQGSRTDSHIVGERLDSEGKPVETIWAERHYTYGKWLFHPTSGGGEWQTDVHISYFLDDTLHNNKSELQFLNYKGYDGWVKFTAIEGGPYWWSFTPIGFGTNDAGSIAVFDSSGFKHVRTLPYQCEAKVKEGGRVLEFRGTNGWRAHRVLEDKLVLNADRK